MENEEQYQEFQTIDWKYIYEIITKPNTYNVDTISNIIAQIYKTEFICTNIDNDHWLIFDINDSSYKTELNSLTIRTTCIVHLAKYFAKAEKEYTELLMKLMDNDLSGNTKVKIHEMKAVQKLFKNTHFMDSLIAECRNKMFNDVSSKQKGYNCIVC